MNSLSKLLLFIFGFSGLFFWLRIYGNYIGYDISMLISNLGGLAYLYSTVGTIFAIFAAFVIVSESQDWNTLNAASKDEVRYLNEIFLWSKKLSNPLSDRFSSAIQQYLEIVIEKEWISLKEGIENSKEADALISIFHDLLLDATNENEHIASYMAISLKECLDHRSVRVEYSWQPLPFILKFTVILVDIAVVVLSLFIGVRDIWLDYIFMLCIVTLGAVILIVVDDLDNPLRPGEWCLTSDNYKNLLGAIRR